jgi:uncharacterized protein
MRVFADPLALTVQDRIEGGEQRWQTLGLVEGYLPPLTEKQKAELAALEARPESDIDHRSRR